MSKYFPPKRCVFCRSWENVEGKTYGECHGRPPVADKETVVDYFPITEGKNWCDEFRRYEHPEVAEANELVESNQWKCVLHGDARCTNLTWPEYMICP